MMIDHGLPPAGPPPASLAAGEPPAADQLAATFTLQEETFLRHYADSLARFDALVHAGYVASPPSPAALADLQREATRIVGKAEQMPLATLALAIGADKLYFLSRLKWVCDNEQPHAAIKGLQLLARIHGLSDKSQGNKAVALIFTEPRPPHGQAHPADLPFTLPADAYAHVPRGTRDVRPPAPDPERREGAK